MFSSLNETWSPYRVVPLFDETVHDAPPNWQTYKVVREAFKIAFSDAARMAPDWHPSLAVKDRGIVICGGGWRFFPSVYVTVRAIRNTGCTLPIQVWCLGDQGEFDHRMKATTDRFDVEWINAQAFAREWQIKKRRWGGWELKPFAALHCPFREVVCLDADCYPAYDLSLFLDSQEHRYIGATFWPDISSLTKGQWDQFGIPYRNEPAFESGQFAIDKTRHYKALWLTNWMNDRSDYVYSHIYGDKDTFHLSWRKLGMNYCMPYQTPEWKSVGFIHRDFNGNMIFFHRIADKFKWHGTVDGKQIHHSFTSSQIPEHKFLPSIPHEKQCHRWVVECSEMIRPEQHFTWPDTPSGMGKFVWDKVVIENEYELPDSMKNEIVIDIGGNYGAFTYACLYRDAKHVIAVEPHLNTSKHYAHNLRSFADRYTLINKMVSDSNDGIHLVDEPYHFDNDPWSTSLFSGREGETRLWPTIHIDDVIDIAAKKGEISLMKIDAEGAEFPALMASTKLRMVKRIVGECHDFGFHYRGRERTIQDVVQALTDRGFTVRHFLSGAFVPKKQTHLFFADRL